MASHPARDTSDLRATHEVDFDRSTAAGRRFSRRVAIETRGRLRWDKVRTAELFRRLRESEDRAARDELVTSYLNLVQYLASRYRNRGEQVNDLVQVGAIGLIKAIDRFDPERGLEFTTYATPTIVGELKRHFRDKGWAMKVPRRLQELSVAATRAVDELTQENQCSPTIDQIADRLGTDPDQVLLAMESASVYSLPSLDSGHADADGAFSLLDMLGENDPLIAVVEDRATLSAVISDLSPVQQKAVYMRFYTGLTQTQIARELGVSQMQVSRMLRNALAILRKGIGQAR